MESSSDTIPLIYDLSFSTTNVENVLLILGSVEIFKEYTNSNGFPIVHQPIHKRTDILDVLQTRFTQIKRLCIIDHFAEDPDFLEEESLFHDSNVQFLVQLTQTFQITNIDFLACNTLRSDSWKAFYKTLQEQTNVIIGASDDNTGNIKHGGDWVLETTMENVKQIYFNEKVDQYSELLNNPQITTDWGDGTNTIIEYNNFNDTSYTVNARLFISGVIKMPETIVYNSVTYTIVSLGTGSTSGTWSPAIIPTLTANVSFFNSFVFRLRSGTFDLRHLYNLRSLPNQFCHDGGGPLYLPYGLRTIASDGFNLHKKDLSLFSLPDTLTNMSYNSLWHSSQTYGELQELIMFDRFGNYYSRNTLPNGLLYSSTYNYNNNTTDSLNAMIFNFSTQKNDTSLWTPIASSTPLPTAGIVGLTSGANHYNLNGTLSQTTFSDLYFNDISMTTANKNLSVDTTHTITMTYEDSKINVYIDGTKEVTDATGASTYDSIVLNRGPDAADNGATGVYDDLKIFNRALTQENLDDMNNIYVLYNVTVSNEVFYIQNNNTISEQPELVFTENGTYIFDQSDPTNAGNTLVLGTVPDSSVNIINYQNIVGNPGQPGAYTTFTASGETVYYYSFESPYMGYQPSYTIVSVSKDSFYPGETTTIRVKNATPYDGAYTITLTDISQSDLNNADLSGSIPKQAITDFTYSIPADVTNVGSFTYSIDGTDLSTTIQITEAPPVKIYTVDVSGDVYWLQLNDYIGPMGLKQERPSLTQFESGMQYEFHYTDNNHPIRLSTTIDGTYGGGVEYTTGVIKEESTDLNISPHKLVFTPSETISLHYYCGQHSGYGDSATSPTYVLYDEFKSIQYTFDTYVDLPTAFTNSSTVSFENTGTLDESGNGYMQWGNQNNLSISSEQSKVGTYSLYSSNLSNTRGSEFGRLKIPAFNIGNDKNISGSQQGFTMMMWVYILRWQGHDRLMGYYNNTWNYTIGIDWYAPGNLILADIVMTPMSASIRTSIPNSWHHLAFRSKPTGIINNGKPQVQTEAIYDGVKLIDSIQYVPEWPLKMENFEIGSISNWNHYASNSYMDDIRVYDEFLPDAEIQRISGLTTPYTITSTSEILFPTNTIYIGQESTTYITVKSTTATVPYTITLDSINQYDIGNVDLNGSIPAKDTTTYKFTIPSDVSNNGSFTFSIDGTNISTTVRVITEPILVQYTVDVSSNSAGTENVYWLQMFDYKGPLGLMQQQPSLPQFALGYKYEFHYTDSINPFKLSNTIDGTNGSYETGVTTVTSTDLNMSPHKLIIIPQEIVTLHYYRQNESGYGDTVSSTIYTTYNDLLPLHYTFEDYIDIDNTDPAYLKNNGTEGDLGEAYIIKGGSYQTLSISSTQSKEGTYGLYCNNYNNTSQNGGYLSMVVLPGLTIANDKGLSGSTQGFTLMVWIYEDQTDYISDARLVSYSNNDYVIGFFNNNIRCGSIDIIPSTDPLRVANQKSWHHFTIRSKPNGTNWIGQAQGLTEAFYDGVKMGEFNSTSHHHNTWPINSSGIYLMANYYSKSIKCYMDDFRMYNEWLPESEILRISGFFAPYVISKTDDFIYPNAIKDTVYISVNNKNSFDGSYTITLSGGITTSDFTYNLTGSIPAENTTVYKYTIPSTVSNTGSFTFTVDGTDVSTTVDVLDGPKTGDIYTVEVSGDVYWLQRIYESEPIGSNFQQPSLPQFIRGTKYEFHYSDTGNPIRLSTTIDGTHGGGTEYTTGVTIDTASTPNKLIVIAEEDINLHYYCQYHDSYGDTATSTVYKTYLENKTLHIKFDDGDMGDLDYNNNNPYNIITNHASNIHPDTEIQLLRPNHKNITTISAIEDPTTDAYTGSSYIRYSPDTKIDTSDNKYGTGSLYTAYDDGAGPGNTERIQITNGYTLVSNDPGQTTAYTGTFTVWFKRSNDSQLFTNTFDNAFFTTYSHDRGFRINIRKNASNIYYVQMYEDNELIFLTDDPEPGNNFGIITEWNHYAFTSKAVDGGTHNITIYLNGTKINSKNLSNTVNGSSNGFYNTTYPWCLIHPNWDYYYKGHIDDVRFYNQWLNDSEIEAIYNNTL